MTRQLRTMKPSTWSHSETPESESEVSTIIRIGPCIVHTPTTSGSDDDIFDTSSDFSESSDRFTLPVAGFEKNATEPLVKPAKKARANVNTDQGRLFENDTLQFVADIIALVILGWLCYQIGMAMFPRREEVARCSNNVEPTMGEPSLGCVMAYLRYAKEVRAGLKVNPRQVFEACDVTCPGN